MYDFIYDQQDIYDFYNEIFDDRNSNSSHSMICSQGINVRQPHLPFCFALESFDDILFQFNDERSMKKLANFRWYILDEFLRVSVNDYM
jgi:hypothetical protein